MATKIDSALAGTDHRERPMVSIVVPMYREADRVPTLVRQLESHALAFGATEIVFVDDGSDDGTAAVVREMLEQSHLDARLVALDRNCGKGAAVRAGARSASGKIIVAVDADGAVSMRDIDRAVSTLLSGEVDLVAGNRRHVDSTVVSPQPRRRIVMSRVFNRWVRLLGVSKLDDTQCGLKAWHARDTDRLFANAVDGYAWDLSLLRQAQRHDMTVADVPVEWSHVPGSSIAPVRNGVSMAVSAAKIRSGAADRNRARALLLALLLLSGFGFRLAVASITDNADARTLTWGSAFVAQGSTDPYRDIIAYSEMDPIPLGGIRSLSLAQGPIGVATGSVPLFIGETAGLLDLGSPPDGHALGTSELFAYKLSYLLPELLVLIAVARLIPVRRNRMIAYGLWAFTPLAIFTWGQGMPDTWTIAVMLWTVVWLRRATGSSTGDERRRAYAAAIAICLIGAFGTKLLPLVLVVPIAALVLRDRALTVGDRLRLGATTAVAFGVAVLPYLWSPYMRANIFTRFEFAMLFDTGGIEVGSGLFPAHLPLALLVAATVWMFLDPVGRWEAWIVCSVLVVTTMSGIITHLMVWALVPIILVARRNPSAALGLGLATGLATTWHVLTYDWLSGLVLYSWDRDFPAIEVWPWINAHVPAVNVVGSTISSAVLVASGFAIVGYLSRRRVRVSTRGAIGAMATLSIVFLACLLAVPLIGGRTGEEVWSFAYAGYPTDSSVGIERGGAWVGAPMTGDAEVDHLTFSIDRSSQPSLDELVFTVVDEQGETAATAAVPLWEAEPKSDRGPVTARFDQPFTLDGAQLVITRRAGPGDRWNLPVDEDTGELVPVNRPLTNLASVATVDGTPRPDITLFDDFSDESWDGLSSTLTDTGRIGGVALSTLLAAALAWLVVTGVTAKTGPPLSPPLRPAEVLS